MNSKGKDGCAPLRERAAVFAAAIAITNLGQFAHATTKSWIGTSGDWLTGTNWTGGIKPTTGDFAVLAKGSGLTCTYDVTTAPFTVGSILIDDGMTLAQTSSTQLNPGSMVIGSTGAASYSIGGGTLGVTNQIILGAGSGSSGSIAMFVSNMTAATVNVGSLGSGSFIQLGGVATFGNVTVGTSSGSGYLDLLGGVFSATGTITIGSNGTIDGNGDGQVGALSTMVLAGGIASGTLNSDGTFISNSGTFSGAGEGTFFSNKGSFIYNGGDTSKWHFDNSGTFILNTNWTASSLTNESGGSISFSSGRTVNLTTTTASDRALSNDGTINLNGGTLNVAGSQVSETIGDAGNGTFFHASGTNNVSNLVLGAGASASGFYNLQSGTLNVTSSEQIGIDGSGSLSQANATHTISGDLKLGVDANSFGGMTIGGGTLTVQSGNQMFVGVNGAGSIGQSNGNVSAPEIDMGYGAASTGNYRLSGGTLTTGLLEISEDQNTATFQQSGGTNAVSELILGDFSSGSHGNYILSGGTLNAVLEVVGSDGLGSFSQLGGTHTISNSMLISGTQTSSGSFQLAGGTLTVPMISIGDNGQFTQTGGVLNVGLINTNTFSQRYSFQAGLLHLTAGTLTVADGGVLGSQISTAANRSIVADFSVDLTAAGLITVNGGSFSIGTLINDGGQISLQTGTLQIKNSPIELGTNQPLGTSLQLGSGANLISGSTTALNIDSNAVLQLSGGEVTATAGVNNNGQIDLASPLSSINGGTLTNGGLLNGTGHINSSLYNITTGEVRADSNDDLQFKAFSNSNYGRFTLNGGRIEFSGGLTNASAGAISGRGSLATISGLINNGSIDLSAGFSDIYGNVTNNNKIIITGGSTTTFYNAVTDNSGATIRIDANSAAVFLGNVSVSGVTGSGTAYYDGAAVGGPLVNAGASVIDPGGSLAADYIRQNALTVSGAATLNSSGSAANFSRVTSLSINGGTFDLANNDLIVDSGSLGAIRSAIQSAYANGTWNGPGLTSSAAAATANTGPKTGIGYALASAINSSTFDGQSVNPSSVLLKYVDLGDANLDGTVNALDFNALATNYGNNNGSDVWSQGDFNYDGSVDSSDFDTLAVNYGQIMASSAVVPLGAMVPEPASFLLTSIAIFGLMARQRRG